VRHKREVQDLAHSHAEEVQRLEGSVRQAQAESHAKDAELLELQGEVHAVQAQLQEAVKQQKAARAAELRDKMLLFASSDASGSKQDKQIGAFIEQIAMLQTKLDKEDREKEGLQERYNSLLETKAQVERQSAEEHKILQHQLESHRAGTAPDKTKSEHQAELDKANKQKEDFSKMVKTLVPEVARLKKELEQLKSSKK
jgi:chromosome segregation ATPase